MSDRSGGFLGRGRSRGGRDFIALDLPVAAPIIGLFITVQRPHLARKPSHQVGSCMDSPRTTPTRSSGRLAGSGYNKPTRSWPVTDIGKGWVSWQGLRSTRCARSLPAAPHSRSESPPAGFWAGDDSSPNILPLGGLAERVSGLEARYTRNGGDRVGRLPRSSPLGRRKPWRRARSLSSATVTFASSGRPYVTSSHGRRGRPPLMLDACRRSGGPTPSQTHWRWASDACGMRARGAFLPTPLLVQA
jgi:hypothetical protein